MAIVGIGELREHLSEYLQRAESGEIIEVKDGDRVVAELRPATRKLPADFFDRPRPSLPEGTVQAVLDELRQDRI